VNYLGPYHLTRLLEPQLAASAPSRVVNVSSIMHRAASVDSNVHRFLTDWKKGSQYANTKLANVLFTYAAQRRLGYRSTGVQASFYCSIVLLYSECSVMKIAPRSLLCSALRLLVDAQSDAQFLPDIIIIKQA